MIRIEENKALLWEKSVSEQTACIYQKNNSERLISGVTLSRTKCHFKLTFPKRI